MLEKQKTCAIAIRPRLSAPTWPAHVKVYTPPT